MNTLSSTDADYGSSGPGPSGGLPEKPQTDMLASPEMQAYLAQLADTRRRIDFRNRFLWGGLAAGVLVLLLVLWGVYRSTIGAYAVIDGIEVRQHPVEQGRLEIRYQVKSPGKVQCRRISGGVTTELIEHFDSPTVVDKPWSWTYRPGKPIELTLRYRSGLFRRAFEAAFPTTDRADIVILIDTTGSMSPCIEELKRKCVAFSEELTRQALKHRFALIGFGDTHEGPWIDRHEFTDDVGQFVATVDAVKRFDGGDFPESALDALEEALRLPFDEGALRRFYLVSDAKYHEPTRTGLTAEQIARRLADEQVMLRVFSSREFESDYALLLGETGKFQEVELFGQVLAEGRLLGE